jgi:hypothetical protein
VSSFLTYWLKYSGDIKIHINNSKTYLNFTNSYGHIDNTNNFSQAERMTYELKVDFLNNSEMQKSLRAITIEFRKGGDNILNHSPGMPSKKNSAIKEITVIDLPPMKYINKCLSGIINNFDKKEKIDFLKKLNNSNIYLKAKYNSKTFFLTNKEKTLEKKLGK